MEFSPSNSQANVEVDPYFRRPRVNVKIKDVNVTKFQRTKPDLIEKILSPLLKKGSVMTLGEFEDASVQAIQRFDALNIFSGINLQLDGIPQERNRFGANKPTGGPHDPVEIGVTISLTEEKVKDLSIMAKTDLGEYPVVTLKGGFKNLFGRCENLQLTLSTEPHITNIDVLKNFGVNLSFEKPFLLWDKPGQKMRLNLDRYKRDHSIASSYSETGLTFGAGFTQEGNPGSHTRRHWTYELTQRNIKCDSNANEKVLLEGGPHIKSAIGHSWNYDSFSDNLYAGEGTFVDLATEVAGLGGDVSHFKQTSNFSTVFLLGSDVSLSLGLKTGLHVPLFSRSFISDRYFLGGLNNFRGFTEKGLGPRAVSRIGSKDIEGNFIGGDMFYASSIDLSVPIANPKQIGEIKLHLFSHFGNIDSFREGDNSLEKLKHYCSSMTDLSKSRLSVGAGLVYRCPPVGKFELNFNVPLKFQPGDSRACGIQFGISDLFS
jgi:outer membrane protein assembly factor BamA